MNLPGWLRSLRGGSDPARVAALRQAVVDARARVAVWKERHAAQSRRAEALAAQLARAEEQADRLAKRLGAYKAVLGEQKVREAHLIEQLERSEASLTRAKQVAERTHRGVLVPRILRGTFRYRLPMARVRARQPEAQREHERFLGLSPSYARAVAVAAVPPGEGTPMLRMNLQGLHWWVPILRPRDGEPSSPWLSKQKLPYRGIAQTRETVIGGIMLDLGANLGRMSLPRLALGDVRAVYCAEPDPLNYECLVRNIVDNGLQGLIMADHTAIGDRDGVAPLARQRYSGGHTLAGSDKPSKGGTVEVPMTTLDGWVNRLGIDLDLVTFVKMDVQGWEGQVCAGGVGVLARRHITWQAEYQPELLRAAGTDPAELLRVFADAFTHFTDINKLASGERGRPVAELVEAVRYLDGDPSAKTDLLLFSQAD